MTQICLVQNETHYKFDSSKTMSLLNDKLTKTQIVIKKQCETKFKGASGYDQVFKRQALTAIMDLLPKEVGQAFLKCN